MKLKKNLKNFNLFDSSLIRQNTFKKMEKTNIRKTIAVKRKQKSQFIYLLIISISDFEKKKNIYRVEGLFIIILFSIHHE